MCTLNVYSLLDTGIRNLWYQKPGACIPEARACRWFIGIARGIKYLHSCKPPIIHRDLKPENVLLTSTDATSSEAKVLDLGLHIRGRSRSVTHVNGDRETSYYGGENYDAVTANGSVRSGRMLGKLVVTQPLTTYLCAYFPQTLQMCCL